MEKQSTINMKTPFPKKRTPIKKRNFILIPKIYNPFKKPPDIILAEKHLKATSVNKGDIYEKENINKLCKCCGRNFHVEKLTIFSKLSKFYHLGISYPFFFKMLIFFICIFLISFLSYGIVALVKMPTILKCSLQNYCEFENFEKEYKDNIYFTHSFAIVNIILLVIAKYFFLRHLKKIEIKIILI